jgi:flagellar FliL protein
MADEEKKEDTKPASSGGKGLMIVLLILVVLLIGAVAGGGYYLYSQGFFDKASEDGAPKQEKKVEAKEEDNLPVKFKAEFKDMVLNITKQNGREALMKLSFTIKSTEETIKDRADENKAEILDAVITTISTKTAEELGTLGGQEVLKEELILSINDILNENITEDNEESSIKNSVKKLFYTNFVIK